MALFLRFKHFQESLIHMETILSKDEVMIFIYFISKDTLLLG